MTFLALNLADITINSLGPSFSKYILVQDLKVLWLLGWEVWSFTLCFLMLILSLTMCFPLLCCYSHKDVHYCVNVQLKQTVQLLHMKSFSSANHWKAFYCSYGDC